MQLTIFADGEPRIKPLLIFKGTGQRIPGREKRQYDPRVVVKFQEKAWCNEEMMVFWLRNMWKKPNMFGQPREHFLSIAVLQNFIVFESAEDRNLRAFFNRVKNVLSYNIFTK